MKQLALSIIPDGFQIVRMGASYGKEIGPVFIGLGGWFGGSWRLLLARGLIW